MDCADGAGLAADVAVWGAVDLGETRTGLPGEPATGGELSGFEKIRLKRSNMRSSVIHIGGFCQKLKPFVDSNLDANGTAWNQAPWRTFSFFSSNSALKVLRSDDSCFSICATASKSPFVAAESRFSFRKISRSAILAAYLASQFRQLFFLLRGDFRWGSVFAQSFHGQFIRGLHSRLTGIYCVFFFHGNFREFLRRFHRRRFWFWPSPATRVQRPVAALGSAMQSPRRLSGRRCALCKP